MELSGGSRGDVPGLMVGDHPRRVLALHDADGTIVLRSCIEPSDVLVSLVDYLELAASTSPDRVFLGQRGPGRTWETITYAKAWERVQSTAQGLIDAGLPAGAPVMILSGASIDHAIFMFAAMLIGSPAVPVSPSYSLIADARPRLAEVVATVPPAMVYVEDEADFASVADLPRLDVLWISRRGGDRSASIESWTCLQSGAEVADRRSAVTPDTVGKILFTSGSTGSPKGVINTQGMLCHAVAGTAAVLAGSEPPIQVDWMPWHHTMGGNTTLHGTLRLSGSLYIDDGRPAPHLFDRTVENLRDMPPTLIQSVPAAYALLVARLEGDDDLRTRFFSRIERMIYAGASLPQDVWIRMQALAVRTIGRQVSFGSGYGTTETGPGVTITHWPSEGGGVIGLPLPGVEVKLVPIDDTYELRVRGRNVSPGYHGRPDLTAAAFDNEGFYRVGDLVRLVDPINPALGLRFAGRLSENFKLTNGSWVSTSELRLTALEACRPFAQDLVVAGADRADVRLLIWPVEGQEKATARAEIAERLRSFNAGHSGATHTVAAFILLDEPPTIGGGETTDKGYINQRGVLARRAAAVEALYSSTPSSDVETLVQGKVDA